MDPVIHFQMPSEDAKRVSDFYSTVFGWEMKQLGPEMGDYLLASAAKSDDKGMSMVPGAINGGFFKKNKPDQYPNIIINVADIQEAMKKVAAAGGTVLGGMASPSEPDNVPGVGLMVSIRDTEGNLVCLMQRA